MKLRDTLLSLLLTPLMAVLPLQVDAAESVPAGPAATLQIRLADAAQPVVEANTSVKGYAILITDAAGSPVADAAVAIRLPEEGVTGFFLNGERSAVAYTNAAGVATFNQINWSSMAGSAMVRVTVVKGDLRAGAMIEQTVAAHALAKKDGPAASKAPATAIATAPAPTTAPATASAVLRPFPAPASKAAAVSAPGTPVSVATVHSGATPAAPAAQDKPAPSASTPEPVVSIVNTGGSSAPHSNKKWALLAVVGVAAGVGAALALSGKGAAAASSTPNTGISIGSPTISVGH